MCVAWKPAAVSAFCASIGIPRLGVHLGGERRDLPLGDVADRLPDRLVLLGQGVQPSVVTHGYDRRPRRAVSSSSAARRSCSAASRATTESARSAWKRATAARSASSRGGEDADGEQPGVAAAADAHRRHRHAGRHLHDRQQAVQPVEPVQRPGHADDRQRRRRGDHAGQVGRSPGAGDDHPQAAAGRGLGVVEHPARRPVGGDARAPRRARRTPRARARPAPSPASRSRCP